MTADQKTTLERHLSRIHGNQVRILEVFVLVGTGKPPLTIYPEPARDAQECRQDVADATDGPRVA
jgi:hypothetical protein